MKMTRDQAAFKWCPLARVMYHRGESGNRTPESWAANSHCIGPRCMAWEWSDGEFEHHRSHLPQPVVVHAIFGQQPLETPVGVGWELTGAPAGKVYLTADIDLHWKRPMGALREGFCGALAAKITDISN